jgi:nucleotide-binding universal stress UspA family protein
MLMEKGCKQLMFTNVIVPLDGTPEAVAAIPVARTLAALGGGRLSLVRVVQRPAGLFASHVNQVRDAAAYLERVVAQKLAGVDLSISTHVRSGDVVQGILGEVDENASSVIVMTTRGRGGVARAVLGSVASGLLAKSPVPVVLVRAGTRPVSELREILVPVDGSPESERSLAVAAELGHRAGANVTVLEVVTPSPVPAWAVDTVAPVELSAYVDPGELDRAALDDASQYVAALADRLGTQHTSTDAMAILGEVPSTITKTADARHADLIVMRTRGHTGTARAVLGSVADAVARSSPVPVMLLPGDRVSEERATLRQRRSLVGEPVW